jgi:hypothetical protein
MKKIEIYNAEEITSLKQLNGKTIVFINGCGDIKLPQLLTNDEFVTVDINEFPDWITSLGKPDSYNNFIDWIQFVNYPGFNNNINTVVKYLFAAHEDEQPGRATFIGVHFN